MNDSQPADEKAHIRHALDLTDATWHRAAETDEVTAGPATEEGALEWAFVPHTDGVTYVALRQSANPEGTVLVFTPAEWDAFIAGARDGEFDHPW